jgi:hypothetical protein
MATIAWLLNLDADRELGDLRHYRPDAAMDARIAGLSAQLTTLLSAGDRIVGLDADCARCDHALAFCPTPTALARLAQARLAPPAAPSPAILAAVNSRAFCAALGQTLPGARYVRSMAELDAVVAAPSPSGAWLLKRDFAFAGRERRRVDAGGLDASTAGFAQRSFARGEGLQVEPLLARTDDLAQHGYLRRDGTLLVGPLMRQHCDARGVWQGSTELPPDERDDGDLAALAVSVYEVGRALGDAGYFGPFGVDAYHYRDADGTLQLQPRSELNARFSMGYPRALLEQALR